MSHTTFSFDAMGVSHFGQTWTPKDETKAVMVLVHGHGEHSSRYADLAAFLNAKGIAVWAYDFYGHGKTGGKRGSTPSYEGIIDTVDIAIQKAQAEFPGKSLFLFGHSMGGNFVANYGISRQPDIQGIILSAPWLELAFAPKKMDIVMGKVMLRLYPKYTQASGLETAALSRDAEVVQQYENDPLVHDQIGPALGLGCMEKGSWAIENAGKLSLPLLHYHGTADRITSWKGSERFANKAGGDTTWKAWEGYYHELHNEPTALKMPVWEMLRDWVLKRI